MYTRYVYNMHASRTGRIYRERNVYTPAIMPLIIRRSANGRSGRNWFGRPMDELREPPPRDARLGNGRTNYAESRFFIRTHTARLHVYLRRARVRRVHGWERNALAIRIRHFFSPPYLIFVHRKIVCAPPLLVFYVHRATVPSGTRIKANGRIIIHV